MVFSFRFLVSGLMANTILRAIERGQHGVPGEQGAFPPGRIIAQARELLEPLSLGLHSVPQRVRRTGSQRVKTIREALRLGEGLPHQRFRHERGRSRGDGAALPVESGVANHAFPIGLEIHM